MFGSGQPYSVYNRRERSITYEYHKLRLDKITTKYISPVNVNNYETSKRNNAIMSRKVELKKWEGIFE